MVRTRGQQQRARTTKGKRTPQSRKRSSVPAQRNTPDYERFLKAMHVTHERRPALAGSGLRGFKSAADTLKKGPAFRGHLKHLRHADALYRRVAAANPPFMLDPDGTMRNPDFNNPRDAAQHAADLESDRQGHGKAAWLNLRDSYRGHSGVSDMFTRDAFKARADRLQHMSKFFNY